MLRQNFLVEWPCRALANVFTLRRLQQAVNQGRIQPVSSDGAISVIFGSQASLWVHYCKRDGIYFTTMLSQNNGRQNGGRSPQSPPSGSAPPLNACLNSFLLSYFQTNGQLRFIIINIVRNSIFSELFNAVKILRFEGTWRHDTEAVSENLLTYGQCII